MKKFVYLYLHNIVYFHKIPYVYTMLTMLVRIVLWEKAYLRKAVIGGNLVFGIG